MAEPVVDDPRRLLGVIGLDQHCAEQAGCHGRERVGLQPRVEVRRNAAALLGLVELVCEQAYEVGQHGLLVRSLAAAGLGHEKFHLVGISRGAWLALDLATRSGDRIASVIAFEPGGFGTIGLRFVLWSFGQMFRWLLPAPILRRIMSGDPYVRRTLAPLVIRGLKYKPHFPPQYVFTDDELRAIDVPVHFVLAERNGVFDARELAARVEALNPRLRAEIVPKTTHALPLEEPELVISRILTLVEDHGADFPE